MRDAIQGIQRVGDEPQPFDRGDDEDTIFWFASKGSKMHREYIVRCYLPLILATAVRYAGKRERAEDDLVGALTESAFGCIARFEYSTAPGANGPRFSAYLRKRLNGAALNCRRDNRLLRPQGRRGRELYYNPDLAESPEDHAMVENNTLGCVEFHDEAHVMNEAHPSPEDEALELERKVTACTVTEFLEEHLHTWEMRELLNGRTDKLPPGRLDEVRALVSDNFPNAAGMFG